MSVLHMMLNSAMSIFAMSFTIFRGLPGPEIVGRGRRGRGAEGMDHAADLRPRKAPKKDKTDQPTPDQQLQSAACPMRVYHLGSNF